MALNIKDPETDRLVRRLAERTGESITTATKKAVEERLARLGRTAPGTTRDELMEVVRRGRNRPAPVAARTDDEILGYGPDGLPA